jgi:hypothetical protein
LPAGISYWHHGRFFAYHHNPPVTKLLFAIPAVMTNVRVDYRNYYFQPGSRHPDFLLGQDFMQANRSNYHGVFVRCRFVSAAIAVFGGCLIFAWAREMFDDWAALLSQCLWTFSPMVLAHGGLVTPDIGATVIGCGATYLFWRYLRRPGLARLIASAVGLGLAIGCKFTLVILPFLWAILAGIAIIRRTETERQRWPESRICLDAFVLTFVALMVLNITYLYEGSGMPLGRYRFFSKALTVAAPAESESESRVNRFHQEFWKWLPIPLPQQFLMGFDHQMRDLDSGQLETYLHGEFRRGTGWWYYYLYAYLVKTPIGTLLLLTLAITKFAFDRRKWFDTAFVLLPVIGIFVLLSTNTALNIHSRYMLLAYPYLFVFIGPVVHCGTSGRWRKAVPWAIALALASNIVSVLLVHPFYLTYFNEGAGGPRNGYRHLTDSNIDWGQGLVALRSWMEDHPSNGDIQLAYFGAVDPGVYGISFEVPGVLERGSGHGPRPGIHVISVNYIAGSSFAPLGPDGHRRSIPKHGYQFYNRLAPIATVGNCFQVFDLTESRVNRLRADAGLPPRLPVEQAATEPSSNQ